MAYYPSINVGTNAVSSLGDGSTINVSWFQAGHSALNKKIAYNIYYSTVKEDVFYEGPKYVSIDGSLQANLIGLDPGQLYHVAVRAIEYDPNVLDLASLPIAYDNLRVYPSSVLRSDITATDLTIPLLDASDFLSTGFVKIGAELIQYASVNYGSNNLNVVSPGVGTGATLVDQGSGNYYTRKSGNVGDGYLINLAIYNTAAITQDWHIKCIFVQNDGYVGSKFISIGSLSGVAVDGYFGDGYIRDGYSDPIVWEADGYVACNNAFSFKITEGNTKFRLGDEFLVKVSGSIPGSDSGRGADGTIARSHTVAGYDGYDMWNPTVITFTDGEQLIYDRIYQCQSRFEYPNFPYTTVDGYHQVLKDILSTDLSAADADNVDFPAYDYSGYHRTDPVALLTGECVGSYMGGEQGCIDKNGNVHITRGFNLEDQNTQRQEILLSMTGKPAVLVKRVNTGITCSCYLTSSESQDDRCPVCLGGKFVLSFDQYFNPRRSDGRILVRTGPAEENLKRYEAGMESEFPLDLWTLTVPTIKTRDVIILFDQDNNEEFRYEVAGVTRNNTIIGLNGGQKLRVTRIRKTDPAYQIRVFADSSMFPSKLDTSISLTSAILPHKHTIVTNEKTLSISQINQTTSISQAHSHQIISGVVMPILGHTHTIIL